MAQSTPWHLRERVYKGGTKKEISPKCWLDVGGKGIREVVFRGPSVIINFIKKIKQSMSKDDEKVVIFA